MTEANIDLKLKFKPLTINISQQSSSERRDLHHKENENKFGLKNLTSLGNVSGLSSINSPTSRKKVNIKNFVIEENEIESDNPKIKRKYLPEESSNKYSNFKNKKFRKKNKIKSPKKEQIDAFTHFKLEDENMQVYKNNPELVRSPV